jgi:hypothetical protein
VRTHSRLVILSGAKNPARLCKTVTKWILRSAQNDKKLC